MLSLWLRAVSAVSLTLSTVASVALLRQRIPFGRIIHFKDRTEDGVSVKSLVWRVESGGKLSYAVTVLRDEDRVERNKLALLLNTSTHAIHLASTAEAQSQSGFIIGCIPPIGHSSSMPIYMDRQVKAAGDLLIGGGGEPGLHIVIPLRMIEQRVTIADFSNATNTPSSHPIVEAIPSSPVVAVTPSVLRSLSSTTKSLEPVISRLLAAGHSVDERGGHGKTALHFAAYSGATHNVRSLLEAGADINAAAVGVPHDKWRPIMFAAAAGRREVMELLIELNAKVCYSTVALAIRSNLSAGMVEIMKELAKGEDIVSIGDGYPEEEEEMGIGKEALWIDGDGCVRSESGADGSLGEQVEVEGIVVSRRQVSRALLFANIVPRGLPTPAHPVEWFVWPSRRAPCALLPSLCALQIIIGKTLCDRLGREEAAAVCRSVKLGRTVRVTGRLQSSIEEANVDMIVSSIEILQPSQEIVSIAPEPPATSSAPVEAPSNAIRLREIHRSGTDAFRIDTLSAVLSMQSYFKRLINDPLERLVLLGLDCEWEPERDRSNSPGHLVSVLQLSDGNSSFVLDMLTMCSQTQDAAIQRTEVEDALNDCLLAVFRANNVAVLAFGVGVDIGRLASSYPHMPCFHFYKRVLDLQPIYKPLFSKGHGFSLNALCRMVLGRSLDKSQQTSHWGTRPLTAEQIEYGAIDAAVLVPLLTRWVEDHQRNKNQLSLRQFVDSHSSSSRLTVLQEAPMEVGKKVRNIPCGGIKTSLGIRLAYQSWPIKKKSPPHLL